MGNMPIDVDTDKELKPIDVEKFVLEVVVTKVVRAEKRAAEWGESVNRQVRVKVERA